MGRKQVTRETYTLLCHSFFHSRVHSPLATTPHHLGVWLPAPMNVASGYPLSKTGFPTVGIRVCFVLCDSLCGPLNIRNLRDSWGIVCVFCGLLFISIVVRGAPSHSRVVARSRSCALQSQRRESDSPEVGGFFLMAAITFPNETEAS